MLWHTGLGGFVVVILFYFFSAGADYCCWYIFNNIPWWQKYTFFTLVEVQIPVEKKTLVKVSVLTQSLNSSKSNKVQILKCT